MQQFTSAASTTSPRPVDEYIATLKGLKQTTVRRMYDLAIQLVPEAEQAIYYGMPCLKYNGKGLMSVMSTKKFLSLYPFEAVERLGLDLSAFETTSGSIHFSPERPLPDSLLKAIVMGRLQQITG